MLWQCQKRIYSKAKAPPLSNSDHNTVHLIPTYKSVFKTCKPGHKTVNVWTKESMETLKGSFLYTDWSIFHTLDLDEATTSDYIKFCADNAVHKKETVVYPNNKSYITKEIKQCINKNGGLLVKKTE